MATSIHLSKDLEQRLDHLAEKTGRSKAFYLRELIERGLDDLEDFYLAQNTLARIQKSEKKVLNTDEMRNELGLEN